MENAETSNAEENPYATPQSETIDAEPEQNKDARNWGMFCHLSSLTGLVIPFGNLLGPLVVWLVKKDEFSYADEQGKESLNFQITLLFAGIVCGLLMFVFIGFLLLPLLAAYWLVLTIIASVKASKGEHYRYPLTLRLIK